MAHSIAVPVVSVPPLRNSEHNVTISGFVGGYFRPSTVKSNNVSRYENSAAVGSDPGFFTAARLCSMNGTNVAICCSRTSNAFFRCFEKNGRNNGK
ncbi:hypothetical protein HanXRQr2_Chr14g0661191 [Helianthus annuus]|uniref:Uncharacterized protein n=1 Tax=Helianthus annuus TaxID=4232 RepID=A0A9K3EBR6_HELAN|nr:hypothetical protein HanXRQr2_Chr14g0661191 [Helianthus annuus]KAJ0841793.1 hypothetical protein HanPSC8_Chr14g0634391 [Helianthus annuus]